MIALHETGMTGRVDCVRTVVAYAAPANPDILPDNPLGKIPALLPDEGPAIFDSPVILEYLDTLHDGPRLIPADIAGRIQALRWQALGDGITDMLLRWRNEMMRPQGEWPVVTAAFAVKLRAAMAMLNAEAAALTAAPFGVGHIAVICAIGQLDFRFVDNHWRDVYPALATWYAAVSERPSVIATAVVDDPSPTPLPAGYDGSTSPIDFLEPA